MHSKTYKSISISKNYAKSANSTRKYIYTYWYISKSAIKFVNNDCVCDDFQGVKRRVGHGFIIIIVDNLDRMSPVGFSKCDWGICPSLNGSNFHKNWSYLVILWTVQLLWTVPHPHASCFLTEIRKKSEKEPP